jgi:hypothetical protein
VTLSNPLHNLSEVPTELGMSATNFDLGQHAVRALAGVGDTGAFDLSALAGKSAYTSIGNVSIGGDQNDGGTAFTDTISATVTFTGGAGPFTYAWTCTQVDTGGRIDSTSGQGTQTFSAVLDALFNSGVATAHVNCTVSDGRSSAASPTQTWSYTNTGPPP